MYVCIHICWISLSNRHVWSYVLGSFMSIYYPAQCKVGSYMSVARDIQQIYCSIPTGQHSPLQGSCCPVWALQHIHIYIHTYSREAANKTTRLHSVYTHYWNHLFLPKTNLHYCCAGCCCDVMCSDWWGSQPGQSVVPWLHLQRRGRRPTHSQWGSLLLSLLASKASLPSCLIVGISICMRGALHMPYVLTRNMHKNCTSF